MRILITLLLFISSSFANAEDASNPRIIKETISPNFTNYRVEGSLAASHELPCITIDQAKNTYTPADLYPSVAKCILEKRESAELFFLAGVYAVYDALRIADKTAGAARQALIMNNIGPIEQVKKDDFTKEIKLFSDPKSKEAIELCQKIKDVGRPDYHPQYMILHGMAVFLGNIKGNGLVEDYSEEETWEKALAALSCIA